MSSGQKLLLWLLVVIVLGYAAIATIFPSYAHRFRLIIEVDTSGGVRTGSGVIEASIRGQPMYPPVSSVKGDAVFVDLGEGKHVIALLTTGPRGEGVDGPSSWAVDAFDLKVTRPLSQYIDIRSMSGRRPIKPGYEPTFVTFGDLADPKTARVVPLNGFAEAFGDGYAFKSATVELVPAGWWPLNLIGLTGTPVTRGIEGRLVWHGTRAVSMPPGWTQFTETQRNILAVLQKPFKLRD